MSYLYYLYGHAKKETVYMDILSLNAAPSRLYALKLRLRPLDRGSLMPFSGELVHGAWLDWVRRFAPDVASWLHGGNKRRLFTCSSLQFPLPAHKMYEAERGNVHLPLDPARTYTLRMTLLLGELFPLFYDSLMQFNTIEDGVARQPFIKLGKQIFLLEEVVSGEDDPSGWTGFISFEELLEAVKQVPLAAKPTFTLDFASLTTFNRSSMYKGTHTNYYARLPLPYFVFPGLARRWQELAPPELVHIIQKEHIEQYTLKEGVFIEDYMLQTHQVRFVNHPQKGFVGSCSYQLRDVDIEGSAESPLSIQQQILLLTRLAFYTGIGYKPAMGMGQSRCR